MKLKMLAAWMRSSSARDSLIVIDLLSDISITNCPGPSMMLRPASPNAVPFGLAQVFAVPEEVDGAQNAAVLNHAAAEGFVSVIGAPVTSARSEPLTPRSMSKLLPRTRGVYHKPLATVKSPLSDHALKICESAPRCKKRCPSPKGNSAIQFPVNLCV